MDRDKLCDPREIPEEQWSNDVSLWPELEFGQIYPFALQSNNCTFRVAMVMNS